MPAIMIHLSLKEVVILSTETHIFLDVSNKQYKNIFNKGKKK